MAVHGGRRQKVHRTKPARIVECDARAVVHVKHHMVVFLGFWVRTVELALRITRYGHAARHAQMHEQGFVCIKINQQVFGAAAQRRHRGACQTFGHIFRERPAQIGAVDLSARYDGALHGGLQAASDGFNFGQFGHVCSFSWSGWQGGSQPIGLRDFGMALPMRQLSACVLRNRRIVRPCVPLYEECEPANGRRMTEQTDKTTHFGFETVPEAEKAGRVQGVFGSVASKYDVMNDVMSMGIHRIWKDAMMDWLAPRPGQRLLDVAGGTGDISFRFLKRAGQGHATVFDLTEPMLVEGRKRAEADQMVDSLDWVAGDAMALPFEDNSFDVYTISFGIRNVTRPQEALNEAFRVLKPGGRLMVLEFSQIPNDMMQKAYDLYSFNVIPRMGQLIANDRDSYQYLVESIRNFPDQETFLDMVRQAGFENAKYRNLSLGIAALHSGWKL